MKFSLKTWIVTPQSSRWISECKWRYCTLVVDSTIEALSIPDSSIPKTSIPDSRTSHILVFPGVQHTLGDVDHLQPSRFDIEISIEIEIIYRGTRLTRVISPRNFWRGERTYRMPMYVTLCVCTMYENVYAHVHVYCA